METLDPTTNNNKTDSAPRGGGSYLHVACQSHYVEAVKVLLEMGAKLNINDELNKIVKKFCRE